MKEQVDTLSAIPSKRLYLSIIADYDTNKAVCELIDNALDIWVKNGRAVNLRVNVDIDPNQQRIQVVDNAGGIPKSDLTQIVAPGHTGNTSSDAIIGIFGVGTKRAVVALAQEVRIRTRDGEGRTHQVEFDDDWIKASDDWDLPVFRVDDIDHDTTIIDLTRLRSPLTKESIKILREHLCKTYARFLTNRKLRLTLNGEILKPTTFENWAYPPGYEPTQYSGTIKTQDGGVVKVKAVAGLTKESSPGGGAYGVYIYCNDRLVVSGLKSYDVGFASGLAGKPHADISLTRVLIFLSGAAQLMPWNSSKSDISPSHEVFKSLRDWLIQAVKDYASLSRRFSKFDGGWPQNVFKYTAGQVKKVKVLDFPTANTSYLAPLPEMKPRYPKIIQKKNSRISKEKPWTKGLYEGVIAVDWILKQKFEQKNRIALILLDSTLEIAFKEYLVNDSGTAYSDSRIQQIFSNRSAVHQEIKQTVSLPNKLWKKIEYYYKIRCQLVHRKATVSTGDDEIQDFRSVVERILKKLFNLRFEP